MIEELKTLVALYDLKTMVKTATYLRVTQSTVTKRIQHLEELCGQQLVRPAGRKVELTEYGRYLAVNAPEHLMNLEQLLLPKPDKNPQLPRLIIGIAESVLSSEVARGLVRLERKLAKTQIEVHAHRAQVIFDKVQAGEYHIGLCALKKLSHSHLIFEEIFVEPFVIIPSGLKTFRRKKGEPLEVVTIEESAHSWQQIQRPAREMNLLPVRRLETFFAAAQLAINGFGHALVPEGTARALGVLNKCDRACCGGRLHRRIGLLASKTVFLHPEVEVLKSLLAK